jgi:hypothetical protein
MRKVGIVGNRFTQIIAFDEPEFGANHRYLAVAAGTSDEAIMSESQENFNFADISFQKGPIKEFGVNGCRHEDLIAIVLDRLYSFQRGRFSCRENLDAINCLEDAIRCLNRRTAAHQARGVDGTSEV